MNEVVQTNYFSPEVHAMQGWIESEVIKKGTCPPLVRLSRDFTDAAGVIDWLSLSDEVEFISFYNYAPRTDSITNAVSSAYAGYIVDATTGNAPLTSVIILPDFETNDDFSDFMSEAISATERNLLTMEGGEEVVKLAYQKTADAEGLSRSAKMFLRKRTNLASAAEQVVNTAFRPIYFYGQDLTQPELDAFPDNRGPVSRQRILSRAPHFGFQVVAPFGGDKYIGRLNSQRLFARNTRLAEATDPTTYGQAIDLFRA